MLFERINCLIDSCFLLFFFFFCSIIEAFRLREEPVVLWIPRALVTIVSNQSLWFILGPKAPSTSLSVFPAPTPDYELLASLDVTPCEILTHYVLGGFLSDVSRADMDLPRWRRVTGPVLRFTSLRLLVLWTCAVAPLIASTSRRPRQTPVGRRAV